MSDQDQPKEEKMLEVEATEALLDTKLQQVKGDQTLDDNWAVTELAKVLQEEIHDLVGDANLSLQDGEEVVKKMLAHRGPDHLKRLLFLRGDMFEIFQIWSGKTGVRPLGKG